MASSGWQELHQAEFLAEQAHIDSYTQPLSSILNKTNSDLDSDQESDSKTEPVADEEVVDPQAIDNSTETERLAENDSVGFDFDHDGEEEEGKKVEDSDEEEHEEEFEDQEEDEEYQDQDGNMKRTRGARNRRGAGRAGRAGRAANTPSARSLAAMNRQPPRALLTEEIIHTVFECLGPALGWHAYYAWYQGASPTMAILADIPSRTDEEEVEDPDEAQRLISRIDDALFEHVKRFHQPQYGRENIKQLVRYEYGRMPEARLTYNVARVRDPTQTFLAYSRRIFMIPGTQGDIPGEDNRPALPPGSRAVHVLQL